MASSTVPTLVTGDTLAGIGLHLLISTDSLRKLLSAAAKAATGQRPAPLSVADIAARIPLTARGAIDDRYAAPLVHAATFHLVEQWTFDVTVLKLPREAMAARIARWSQRVDRASLKEGAVRLGQVGSYESADSLAAAVGASLDRAFDYDAIQQLEPPAWTTAMDDGSTRHHSVIHKGSSYVWAGGVGDVANCRVQETVCTSVTELGTDKGPVLSLTAFATATQ